MLLTTTLLLNVKQHLIYFLVNDFGEAYVERGCTVDNTVCDDNIENSYIEYCKSCKSKRCNYEFMVLDQEVEDYLLETYQLLAGQTTTTPAPRRHRFNIPHRAKTTTVLPTKSVTNTEELNEGTTAATAKSLNIEKTTKSVIEIQNTTVVELITEEYRPNISENIKDLNENTTEVSTADVNVTKEYSLTSSIPTEEHVDTLIGSLVELSTVITPAQENTSLYDAGDNNDTMSSTPGAIEIGSTTNDA